MDYAYLNARMRGMKSRLLSHQALDTLIAQPDLDSVIRELENSPYREEILEAKGKLSGILCIEEALRQNFTRTFRKIQSMAKPEKEAEAYIRIFLHRWDVQNIKTILRGKNIHATPDEIASCLVPVGELDEAALRELLRQPEGKAVIDLLATWRIPYAGPLTGAWAESVQAKDAAVLECALDRFYYADALAAVKGSSYNATLIRELLQEEIDSVNLRTVFRMVRDSVAPGDARRYFIAGGQEFGEKDLLGLMALPSVEEVSRALAETRFRFLAGTPGSGARSRKIPAIERELERFLVKKGVGMFLLDPLSVASVIGYFWAKYNEITNIRIIARTKTVDFPRERLMEELVYV